MIVLACVFILGVGLGFLPWRPVAAGLGGLAIVLLACWHFGIAVVFVPLGILMAPAVLLGWACGLLIRRTRAERKGIT